MLKQNMRINVLGRTALNHRGHFCCFCSGLLFHFFDCSINIGLSFQKTGGLRLDINDSIFFPYYEIYVRSEHHSVSFICAKKYGTTHMI